MFLRVTVGDVEAFREIAGEEEFLRLIAGEFDADFFFAALRRLIGLGRTSSSEELSDLMSASRFGLFVVLRNSLMTFCSRAL